MPLTAPAVPESIAPAPRPRRVLRRIGLVLVVLVVVALLVGGLWLRSRMQASLPQVEGTRALPGLAAAVTIERDALGVPTVRGANRLDVARGLGFLHAQERFFQMDLLRHRAAGELAEILGPRALQVDRRTRLHRFRAVAEAVYHHAVPADRAVLDAYAEGVNAGLAALGAPPFEYALLRVRPVAWRPEDSILAVHAMFLDLQEVSIYRESSLGVMHDVLPEPLFAFLAPEGTEWDAPLVGGLLPPPPLPGPEVVDLRRQPPDKAAAKMPAAWEALAAGADEVPGSNNWALAASRTADGHALVANDMHLGLRVPNTWYRASLVWPADPAEGPGGERRMTGVTLPGTPAVVAGSNGHVAWGFTNSQGDWADLIVLETDPSHPDSYRTPEGFRRFTHTAETLRVKGAKPQTLDVVSTIWGPVFDRDHLGRPRALAWTAHREEAVNLKMLDLERAKTIDEAIAVAQASGPPAQNFMVADDSGRIGWTIIGRIPHRVGFDGQLPTSWADGTRRWDGWLAPGEAPRVVDPPAGQLWTANARTMGGEPLQVLGDSGYALGARARQIRDDLTALAKATPKDLLAIQLDDRAVFLTRWRDLLLKTLSPEAVAGHPRRAELRRLVETTWDGHAGTGSPAYRIVHDFHFLLRQQVMGALTRACLKADPEFAFQLVGQSEEPLWRLVTERPPHLLASRFHTWDEQLLAAVDATVKELSETGPDLSRRTWGEENVVAIRHPLSAAVPGLSRFLDMPAQPLPGDVDMPRVQRPAFGASERFVVSPGHEEQGFFHMPAGQSGNPLSPHYGDSNPAWAKGEPTPFLPGPTVHRLTLVPR
ncbi:MAG TPA: penicillin acylase family protein [Thermoanaerobaculia bacterium]|nr:penicillin acylase family protein [Thermoanaerobaculia bacterium]